MTNSGTAEIPAFAKSVEEMPTGRMQCMEVCGGNHFTARKIEFGGLDCWIYSKPHEDAPGGGDVFYASSCATGRISRLLLADVAGHGNSAASVADDLHKLMRRFVNRLDQAEFVRLLNSEFACCSQSAVFATAIVTTFFAPSRRLRLCNAGHPRPLLYTASTGQWSLLGGDGLAAGTEPSNLPLGILEQNRYEHFDIELEPGDFLLAYTDGLSESCDASGEMLGEAGLLQILRRIGEVEPSRLIAALKDDIAQRHPSNLRDDDITIMLVRANGREPFYSLGDRLRAVGRFVYALIHALDPHAPYPPLPDLMLANIGGALLPTLGRRWRAPRSSSS